MSVLQEQANMLRAIQHGMAAAAEAARALATKDENDRVADVFLQNAHLLLDISGACRRAAKDLDEQHAQLERMATR